MAGYPNKIKMNAKALLNSALHRLAFGLLTFMVSVGLVIVFLNKVDANNPTFFLSSSSGCSMTGEVSGTVGDSKTLYVCVDGNNEGAGLFGGEISISYDTSLISVTSVSCRNFDSCSNLSEPGRVRLLGSSAPAPEGNAVTSREVFGSLTFNLKKSGTAQLTYTLARVVDERQGVQSRSGIGAKVTIQEPTPPPAPTPAPTTPTPVPTPPAPIPPASSGSETPQVQPPAPQTAQSLSRVVISPLKRTGTPGEVIHIISRADYNGGRPTENITSCFNCPTANNKVPEGVIKYKVTGPANVYANRVTLNTNAKAGQIVKISATYTDFKSNTTATSGVRTITVAAANACDPATGLGCAPGIGGPSDLTAPQGGGDSGCFDASGAPIACPVPEPGCFDASGAPISCTPGGGNGGGCDPTFEDCSPPEKEPDCSSNPPAEGCIPPEKPECDPNTQDCGGGGNGGGCDPNTQDCTPPGEQPGCFDASGAPIECPKPDCDPNTQDCGGELVACDPNIEDCAPEQENCDPNTQDCGGELIACDPDVEDCSPGQENCDPNTQDCGGGNEPDCQQGDCGKKEVPGCDDYDCEPGKKDHKLICHVLDVEKDKLIGALIYLPQDEADKHLNEHDPDYEVSDIDKNPDNDSEDCLGIDICEYKKLHGSANETNQCDTQELLTLTEMSLFHPAEDDCVTCTLFVPAKPTNEFCAAKYPIETDSDKDGLSDRTECYLNTDINGVDSDHDTCWDGDEVNLFSTNPLVQTDCALSDIAYGKVVITDPKNNWTVKSLDISGITPKATLDVGLTAFPASHKILLPVIEAFDKLASRLQEVIDPNDVVAQEKKNSELRDLTKDVKTKIQAFYKFTESEADINYEKQKAVLKSVESYLQKTPQEMQAEFSQAEALKRSLQTIKTGGVFLGLVSDFKEVAVGDEIVSGFNLVPRIPVEDGLYDLVAVARLKNKTLTSEPVRISLDSNAEVNTPRPEALDGIKLDPSTLKQGWELTSENSLSKVEVKTKNGRPVVSGQSTYGAQIFATWESLSLSSSIIVDSSEGVFEIQAPRELEKNTDHKVSLYAVVDGDKGKIRSDTVTVDFHVEGNNYLLWILSGLVLLVLAALLARRRMKKIDQLPPEHRAKENELYHAFGEKEQPTPLPENHNTKEEEVKSVFGK